MIIASYNVNSVRSRMDILKRWITGNRPDIICLQETKVRDEEFPESEIVSTGYTPFYMGEKSYNGVAILSKIPFDKVSHGFDGGGNDEGTRLISAQFGNLVIVNTYVPQGTSPESEKFQYKLQWFARLKDYFSKIKSSGQSVIWCGDFNVAPDPIDVHNPKRLLGNVGYHPDEHRVLADVKTLGFTDIFRKHVPEPLQYTFWDYRVKDAVGRGLGWRVDHIWALGNISESSKRAWIDREPRMWEKPSDHTVICAEFDL